MNAIFTIEELFHIATVLDGSATKNRTAVINRIDLELTGSIPSEDERIFLAGCKGKLDSITDQEFNNLNFFKAAVLEGTDGE